MNKILYTIKYTITALCFFGMVSCETWIDTDINIDPDSPSEVPLSMLLPSIQADMAYDLGGADMSMPAAIWMQQLGGYSRQMQLFGLYQFLPADVNNVWNSCYSGTLMDCVVLMREAKQQGASNFEGIAKICFATTIIQMTDLFGDIPYSEAFLGSDELSPILDSQESIYTSIDLLLDEAIADLKRGDSPISVSGDMVYNGDVSLWIKAAYGLKARYVLALSNRNSDAYATALSYLDKSFTSVDDDFKFLFGTQPTELHPITQFTLERGDAVMGEYMVELLKSEDDPRLSKYAAVADDKGSYAGAVPGATSSSGISQIGSYLNTDTKAIATQFLTYSELKFIEAECKLGTDPSGALLAYKEAIEASIDQVLGKSYDDAEWLSTHVTNTTSVTLKEIMMQKYICTFGQVQTYNDYRRTGYPDDLVGAPSATREMPMRFPYPQEEITYNKNVEAVWQSTVFLDTEVWWDVN